jgi:hypothetical protein
LTTFIFHRLVHLMNISFHDGNEVFDTLELGNSTILSSTTQLAATERALRSEGMSLKENHPLLQPVLPNENGSGGQLDAEGRAKADLVAAALYRNFVIMSVSFSVNHGNRDLSLVFLNITPQALHKPESFLRQLLCCYTRYYCHQFP